MVDKVIFYTDSSFVVRGVKIRPTQKIFNAKQGETNMKHYDATQEFKPFEKKEASGSNTSHPRPRTGQTAKKKAKQNKEGK